MKPDTYNTTEPRTKRRVLFGVIVILLGVILLCANMGFVPPYWKHILISWQMLLIVIGLANLVSRDNWVPGVILITIGGFFLLPRIFDLPVNFGHLFWPAIIIAIGLFILLRRLPSYHPHRPHVEGGIYSDEGYIHEDNIFGGNKRKIVSQDFRGGEINCIFGGSEVDLSQARLASGVNTLNLSAIFGGVTLIIPCDWKIDLKMTSILGGFTDKRTCIKEDSDPSRILVIKGSAIFGGGEIKSY